MRLGVTAGPFFWGRLGRNDGTFSLWVQLRSFASLRMTIGLWEIGKGGVCLRPLVPSDCYGGCGLAFVFEVFDLAEPFLGGGFGLVGTAKILAFLG